MQRSASSSSENRVRDGSCQHSPRTNIYPPSRTNTTTTKKSHLSSQSSITYSSPLNGRAKWNAFNKPGMSLSLSSDVTQKSYHTRLPGRSRPASDVRQEFMSLLRIKARDENEFKDGVQRMRMLILAHGNVPIADKTDASFIRSKVYKCLLNVIKVSALDYMKLVEMGPSSVHEKIKNDTFRTLATDTDFKKTVSQDAMVRTLSAFVHKMEGRPRTRLINLSYSYVQGMNVLIAPFLFVMTELDAFYAFSTFITQCLPLYVQPSLEGVHSGLALLDCCLDIVDPQLSLYLKDKGLSPQLYAFPSVMTLSACTPPLSQLIAMKKALMHHPSPMKLLRTFPSLDAPKLIKKTLELLPQIPDDIHELLVRHPFDPSTYEIICGSD